MLRLVFALNCVRPDPTMKSAPESHNYHSQCRLGPQKSTDTRNKRKKNSCAPRSKKALIRETKGNSVYDSRADGDTIHQAAGCAANENALRRGGLEASERCRQALEERTKRSR